MKSRIKNLSLKWVVRNWWYGSLWLVEIFEIFLFYNFEFWSIFNQGGVVSVSRGKNARIGAFFKLKIVWNYNGPPCTFSCIWIFLLVFLLLDDFEYAWNIRCTNKYYTLFLPFFKIKKPLLNILLQQDMKNMRNTGTFKNINYTNELGIGWFWLPKLTLKLSILITHFKFETLNQIFPKIRIHLQVSSSSSLTMVDGSKQSGNGSKFRSRLY